MIGIQAHKSMGFKEENRTWNFYCMGYIDWLNTELIERNILHRASHLFNLWNFFLSGLHEGMSLILGEENELLHAD